MVPVDTSVEWPKVFYAVKIIITYLSYLHT